MSSSLGGGGPTGCSIFYHLQSASSSNRSQGLGSTHPDQPRADKRGGIVLSGGDVVEERRVTGDGRQRVAVDVGAPFPAGGVGVAGADVFGLQALEFLLRAKFVGLGIVSRLAWGFVVRDCDSTYHSDLTRWAQWRMSGLPANGWLMHQTTSPTSSRVAAVGRWLLT